MATTLYFALNTASTKEQGTYPATATNYANVTPDRAVTTEGFMLPYKWRAVANLSQSSVNRTTAQTARFGRFFSAPFAQDYTYTHPTTSGDAIQYYLADYQSNLSANHCVQQCHIYVWRPSTGAVVGVIQPVTVLATDTKEPTSTNSIQATRGSYFAGTSGTIDIKAGDILVFEPFATFTQGAATAYTIRFYYGGATDVVTENTVYATPASKVVFVDDLPLHMPLGAITGDVRYEAVAELRGSRFSASLAARAAITCGLVDGSPFISRAYTSAATSAVLTCQTLFGTNLKSISKFTGWWQQEHRLVSAASVSARAFASFPDAVVGEALNLYYSGEGTQDNPAASLGGPRGLPLAGCTFSAAPGVPGIAVEAVHGMREGVYRLLIDTARRSVSLEIVPGLRYFTAGYAEGQSAIALGSKAVGFVVVRIDSPAAQDATISITVTSVPRLNTLFADPTASDFDNGGVAYRCLYLFNDTDGEVANVTLTVSSTSPDAIGIASEYNSDVSLVGYAAARRRPRSIHHKSLDITGWGGIFFMEDAPQIHSELSINSLPAIIATPQTRQATDGVTVQVPLTLPDERDSQGRLLGLTFGPSLVWEAIPARRGVTFWVQKIMTPRAPGENTLEATFTVTADF